MQVIKTASANGSGASQLPSFTMLGIPVHQEECPPTRHRRLGGSEDRTGLVWRRE